MDDFVLAAMLSDPGSTTLPVLVFARLHHGLKPEINALASVIVAIVSLAVLVGRRVMVAAQRRPEHSATRRRAADWRRRGAIDFGTALCSRLPRVDGSGPHRAGCSRVSRPRECGMARPRACEDPRSKG
jgi:ABC-type Fe3+ transport system permease subunit